MDKTDLLFQGKFVSYEACATPPRNLCRNGSPLAPGQNINFGVLQDWSQALADLVEAGKNEKGNGSPLAPGQNIGDDLQSASQALAKVVEAGKNGLVVRGGWASN